MYQDKRVKAGMWGGGGLGVGGRGGTVLHNGPSASTYKFTIVHILIYCKFRKQKYISNINVTATSTTKNFRL